MRIIYFALVALLMSATLGFCDENAQVVNVEIRDFDVQNKTTLEALASLSARDLPVSIAFEQELSSDYRYKNDEVRISLHIDRAPLKDVFDALCRADSRYTWRRDGDMVNFFPVATQNDAQYLLNRRISHLEFRNLPNASDSIFPITKQLPGPTEQIASYQAGGSTEFQAPWSVVMDGVTVREAFNRIAEHMGHRGGWFFGGAKNFRTITFYRAPFHVSHLDQKQ